MYTGWFSEMFEMFWTIVSAMSGLDLHELYPTPTLMVVVLSIKLYIGVPGGMVNIILEVILVKLIF